MKKQVLRLALVAGMIGSIAAGCSSSKKTGGADSTSTVTDSTSKMAPVSTDTTMKDTSKRDTSIKSTNPPQ